MDDKDEPFIDADFINKSLNISAEWTIDERLKALAAMAYVNRSLGMQNMPPIFNGESMLGVAVAPAWFLELNRTRFVLPDVDMAELWAGLQASIDSFFPGQFDWQNQKRNDVVQNIEELTSKLTPNVIYAAPAPVRLSDSELSELMKPADSVFNFEGNPFDNPEFRQIAKMGLTGFVAMLGGDTSAVVELYATVKCLSDKWGIECVQVLQRAIELCGEIEGITAQQKDEGRELTRMLISDIMSS